MLSDHCLSCLSITLVYCGQTVGWIKMPLGTVLATLRQIGAQPLSSSRGKKEWGAHHPHFLAHVYCGQTAEWIKMLLCTEIGLGPRHIMLDGDLACPFRKGHSSRPLFGPCLLWPNGWVEQGVTWYGGRPRPRRHCVTYGPSAPTPKKGGTGAPTFQSMCLVAKRLDG